MKVIFLDIDGVLNNMLYAQHIGKFGRPIHDKKIWSDEEVIQRVAWDPKNVEQLHKLIEKTQAHVVISSTWRICDPRIDTRVFNRIFEAYGLPSAVVGSTPSLAKNRGHEIHEWVNKNPAVERYVILDDNDDPTSKLVLQKPMSREVSKF